MAPTPPLVIPQEFAHISLVMKNAASSREAMLTFGVDGNGQTANGIANAIQTVLGQTGGLKALPSTTTAFNMIKVRLGTALGDPIAWDQVVSVPCNGGSSKVSSNVAVLVHKRTDQGGRYGRGRFFLPWTIGEGSVDEAGFIDGSVVATMQTAINSFLSGLNTQGVPMVVLHRVRKDGSLSGPAVVNYLLVDNLVSTQRRRLGR